MATNNGSNQVISAAEAEFPEAEIIKQAQAGDADAFGKLYQRHMDAIYRYVQHRVTEPDEAENLTQVVFVKAWQGLPRYQPTKTPFRGWLYRIAGNTVIDYYRTHKETADIDTQWRLADEQASPEEALLSAERSQSVRNAISQLKPSYQQVISLRFLDERDYPETAQVLDRQVNAVRVLQHRALSALQKVLAQEQISWIVAVAAVLTLALGGSVVLAAERSLPGDTFYPLKRAVESSLLRVADDTLDVRLHQAMAGRRVDEMADLLAAGRPDLLAAPGKAYGEHLSGIVKGLSLLVEQEPDEARQIANTAIQALALHEATLASIASADTLNHNSALVDSIDAARQAKVLLATMTSDSEPAPAPIPDVGPSEDEHPEPVPAQPHRTTSTDTESPRKSNVPTPLPPSSGSQYSIPEHPAVQANSRPESTAAPSEQRPAGPTVPTAGSDKDSAHELETMDRERPHGTGTDQPQQTDLAPIGERINVRPLIWPFPTLGPAVSRPAAPLAAPHISPPQNHRADWERSPENSDAEQTPDPQMQPGRQNMQSGAQSESVSQPQPNQPPDPDSGEPSSPQHAGQSEQPGPSQAPPEPSSDDSNGGDPANDHADDQANEKPLNQKDSRDNMSRDPVNDAGNGLSGSLSAPPDTPDTTDTTDTDNDNGPSGSDRQEGLSSPSRGQGDR